MADSILIVHMWCEMWSRSVVSDLCDPMNCSPPGSSVHGILQARILEWVAISFSRGSSRPGDQTRVSHIAGRHFTLWATREAIVCSKTGLHASLPTDVSTWKSKQCHTCFVPPMELLSLPSVPACKLTLSVNGSPILPAKCLCQNYSHIQAFNITFDSSFKI